MYNTKYPFLCVSCNFFTFCFLVQMLNSNVLWRYAKYVWKRKDSIQDELSYFYVSPCNRINPWMWLLFVHLPAMPIMWLPACPPEIEPKPDFLMSSSHPSSRNRRSWWQKSDTAETSNAKHFRTRSVWGKIASQI